MCWVQIARTIIVTFVTIKIDLVKAETPDTDDIEVRILESRVSSFSAAYHGHTANTITNPRLILASVYNENHVSVKQ